VKARDLKSERDQWEVGGLWPEMMAQIAERRERAIVRLVQASKDSRLDAYAGAEVEVLNWISTLPEQTIERLAALEEARHQSGESVVDDDGF